MENRQYERSLIDPLELVIEEIDGDTGNYENVPIIVEEVSYAGIRFISDLVFEIDEVIRFHLPSLQLFPFVSGRIVWKKGLTGQRYEYGLYMLEGEA